MPDEAYLIIATSFALCGMGWLALAKAPHWHQVCGAQALAPRAVLTLQSLGAAALASSLLFCLRADHVSMAALVWLMTMTASALVVAFTLAYRPRWLAWLVIWMKSS